MTVASHILLRQQGIRSLRQAATTRLTGGSKLNRHEPATRQRFTLFHEFKHIIDHGRTHQLYRGQACATPERQAEQAADYFAGCALMPRRLLKREWGRSLQDVNALARHFDVSPRAMDVRLAQVGLNLDPPLDLA